LAELSDFLQHFEFFLLHTASGLCEKSTSLAQPWITVHLSVATCYLWWTPATA